MSSFLLFPSSCRCGIINDLDRNVLNTLSVKASENLSHRNHAFFQCSYGLRGNTLSNSSQASYGKSSSAFRRHPIAHSSPTSPFAVGELNNQNAETDKKVTDSTETSISSSSPLTLSFSVLSSLNKISPEEWDACALQSEVPESINPSSEENATLAKSSNGRKKRSESYNPFLSHAFLLALEESGSAVKETGWVPHHLVAKEEVSGEVLAVIPMYLKSHSYGEYVFDHSWAAAFSRFSLNSSPLSSFLPSSSSSSPLRSYYPKLQSCVPFTPATGNRMLLRGGLGEGKREAVFSGLAQAMKEITDGYGISSLHITFPSREEWQKLGESGTGFFKRVGMQYHWSNRGYGSFNDFLMDLKQGRRKNIRQERKKVLSQDLSLMRLRGDDIKPAHWDAFYTFYRNTTNNKWGQAYLTREFFHRLGASLSSDVLLVMAKHDDTLVAGALNLIGGDVLYGRNWGSLPYTDFPFLHFEACYYQAIEAAIELGLSKVEAGAQGEHKIQRGYLPTPTYSAHYIRDPAFREAISQFLDRETVQVLMAMSYIDEDANPFKPGVVSSGSELEGLFRRP